MRSSIQENKAYLHSQLNDQAVYNSEINLISINNNNLEPTMMDSYEDLESDSLTQYKV